MCMRVYVGVPMHVCPWTCTWVWKPESKLSCAREHHLLPLSLSLARCSLIRVDLLGSEPQEILLSPLLHC